MDIDIDIDSLLKLVRYRNPRFFCNASLSCAWGGVLLGSLFSVFPAIWGHVTLLFLLCYRACYGVVVLIYAFSLGVSLEVTTLVTTHDLLIIWRSE